MIGIQPPRNEPASMKVGNTELQVVQRRLSGNIAIEVCPGCGAPRGGQVARIFVSHASKDAEQARALFTWLRDNGHTECFLDVDDDFGIQPGADWERTLYREIERAQAVILVLTANWMASKWCFVEFAQARALGKAIFPVIETPTGERLVGRDLQQIDLTADRDDGLERLSRALSDIALTSSEGFELPEGVPPFPGFAALGEEHAAVIFGREDDLARLMERLRKARTQGGARLIPILGASGAGKSSLLRAGLVPRLRRDARNWSVLPPFRPESDPFGRLAASLTLAAAPGTSEPAQARREAWRTALASEAPEPALREIAAAIREHAGHLDASILIAVDQAEELFTLASPPERDRFLALLSALLAEPLPFHAVLTIRSEYLAALQRAEALTARFEEYSLQPLHLERIGALVRGPARLAGLKVEDGLVSSLIADARSSDALPLIAFTLRRLYDSEQATGALTAAGYQALGDPTRGFTPLDNAVRQAAEQALPRTGRTEADDLALKAAFVAHLVSVNAAGAYVRRAVRESDLPPAARRDIDRLVDARLLVRRAEGAGGGGAAGADTFADAPTANGVTAAGNIEDSPLIEVAHEALFRVWDRLVEWLTDEQDFLVGKARIAQTLTDWQALPAAARNNGLLVGVLLDRARCWLIDRPDGFRAVEREFIKASIARDDALKAESAARQAREARLQRRLTNLAVAAAVVFAVVGGVAAWQWSEADMQAERRREAELNPGNTQWESEQRAQKTEFGDLMMASGDASSALDPYRAALESARSLVWLDRGNAHWQRDVSLSLDRVGDALLVQGDAPGALMAYREGLEIARRLAELDPSNIEWQTDIVFSLLKLYRAGDDPEAHLVEALGILQALADAGRLPVDKQAWVAILERELAVVLNPSSNGYEGTPLQVTPFQWFGRWEAVGWQLLGRQGRYCKVAASGWVTVWPGYLQFWPVLRTGGRTHGVASVSVDGGTPFDLIWEEDEDRYISDEDDLSLLIAMTKGTTLAIQVHSPEEPNGTEYLLTLWGFREAYQAIANTCDFDASPVLSADSTR